MKSLQGISAPLSKEPKSVGLDLGVRNLQVGTLCTVYVQCPGGGAESSALLAGALPPSPMPRLPQLGSRGQRFFASFVYQGSPGT